MAQIYKHQAWFLYPNDSWYCDAVSSNAIDMQRLYLTDLYRPWQLLSTATKFLTVLSGFGVVLAPLT